MRFKGRDSGLGTNIRLREGVGASIVSHSSISNSSKSKPKYRGINGLFCLNKD